MHNTDELIIEGLTFEDFRLLKSLLDKITLPLTYQHFESASRLYDKVVTINRLLDDADTEQSN